MAPGAGLSTSTTVPPDEAFTVLSGETRLRILRTLGDADEPLVFSALYDGVEYDDPANFNYHIKNSRACLERERLSRWIVLGDPSSPSGVLAWTRAGEQTQPSGEQRRHRNQLNAGSNTDRFSWPSRE